VRLLAFLMAFVLFAGVLISGCREEPPELEEEADVTLSEDRMLEEMEKSEAQIQEDLDPNVPE